MEAQPQTIDQTWIFYDALPFPAYPLFKISADVLHLGV
jgi:hypothetical protein